MIRTRLLLAALLLLPLGLSFALSACMSDTRDCARVETRCTEVCDTWYDPWYGYWTECSTRCSDVCVQRTPSLPASCLGQYICAPDHPCHDPSTCTQQPTPPAPGAGAGLCQACDGTGDCYEDYALCLQLTEDPNDPGFCGRWCELDVDCPNGFFCAELVGLDERQCTPESFSCTGLERSLEE